LPQEIRTLTIRQWLRPLFRQDARIFHKAGPAGQDFEFTAICFTRTKSGIARPKSQFILLMFRQVKFLLSGSYTGLHSALAQPSACRTVHSPDAPAHLVLVLFLSFL